MEKEKSLTIYDSNNNQVELAIDEIRKFIAPTANEKEFWMFIQTARMLNLNPIKREIYFIKYQDKANIITGYQVYLERAIRSGLLEHWGVEVEKKDPLKRETWVGVFKAKRTDWTKEFEWKVPMAEVDKKQATWNLMPEFLLKKNTLSQGLRMLVPEILSGMPYTAEEVSSGTSESIMEPLPNVPSVEVPEDEQKKMEVEKEKQLKIIRTKISNMKSTEDLRKWRQKENTNIAKSVMQDEIISMYEERLRELNLYQHIADISKATGLDKADVGMYLDIMGMPNEAMVHAALAGTPEAVEELRKLIDDYVTAYKARQEEVTEEENLFNELNEGE